MLNDADMRWMAASGPVRHYAAGDTLISRDEHLNGLLIILSGAASVEAAGRPVPRRAAAP